MARNIASAINLVSHNEFERGISNLIRQTVDSFSGAIALYGARELPDEFRFETASSDSHGSIDATPRGGDIGSEGRIANIIRNFCREDATKLLNHPTMERLRSTQVDTVVVVDDFIGSGKRVSEYLDALWFPPTIKSWNSYKRIRFVVVAYSATSVGMRRLYDHPSRPVAKLVRFCPTIDSLHWRASLIDAAKKFCRAYAKRFNLRGFPLGFKETGALLVFEHGCPNNVPAIFWADTKGNRPWAPLFPAKRVVQSTATAFPPELVRREPVHVLLEAGQNRLAAALTSGASRPLTDQEALVLALFSQGKRRVETIASAAQLNAREAAQLIEACVEAGWISPRGRITDVGLAEIRGIRASRMGHIRTIPKYGEDEYYPTALRSRING